MTSAVNSLVSSSAQEIARLVSATTRSKPSAAAAKAKNTAQDFEAVFLSNMFNQMFTGIGEEGPLGNATGVGVWRSFLTDEYAKSFAKAGGIGMADHVQRALLAQQEAQHVTPRTP